MPAFTALNVEPEENVVEEVDTTRELQVDEALKRFQTALKLHAQGPRFFDDAADAYDALFEADIFQYPESKTEYERNERLPSGSLLIEPSFAPSLDVTGADVDGTASSLPQAFYLSYKNHGQFVIDCIQHRLRAAEPAAKATLLETPEVLDQARRALDDFNAALDRDPSDAEVWRKTSRVAAFLKSARISRYSLEAAIELDDDPAIADVEPPSLAEGFAGEQLKQQLEVLGDKMALTHPIMKPFLEKGFPRDLERFIDPIPFLPNPATRVATPKTHSKDVIPRAVVDISSYSWAELGLALVRFVAENGFSGQAVSFHIPEVAIEEDIQMEVDKQLQPPESSPPPKNPTEAMSSEPMATDKLKEIDGVGDEPNAATDTPAANDQLPNERGASLPSRKRSQSAAGIPDIPDEEGGENKRSKRTRRRDTAAEEVMDPATLLATQIQPFQAADQNLFQMTKDLLENLGVTDSVTLNRIAEVLDSCASEDRTGKIQNLSTIDLRDSIVKFDEDTAKILLSKRESPQLSLSAFLEHSKSGPQRALEAPAFDDARGLSSFVEGLNEGWNTIHDALYEYVKSLTTTYTKFKWPDSTKTSVVQVISQLDESLYYRVVYELSVCETSQQKDEALTNTAELVYMLFELHLDVFERITNPNSVVDLATRVEARGRLERWFSLATDVNRHRAQDPDDELSLRYLWAAVFATALTKDIPRDHIITCWHSLRDYLAESSVADIVLPNNAVMPEISTVAAEREISKLTTMDFFLGLFQDDMGDPVSVIDTLEPVLNPESVYISGSVPEPNGVSDDSVKHKQIKQSIQDCASQGLRDLWKFLESSSTDLRLLLWARLGEAYGKIKYTTKQFSCFLRSIETIVTDFERDDYANTPADSRKALFMTMLKALDDLIIQSLHLALNDNSSFDIVDEEHSRSTLSALAKVSCLLQIAAMYEDEIRIGMTQASASGSTFTSFLTKLREMQVRTWSLQYTVLKVGIYQHGAKFFPRPENDLADYLAAVHQVLGLRKSCKSSNKIFLKMMRVELLKQRNIENWEDYLGQVLYDLHGLKLGVGIWDVQDHGCPPESLEKRQAMALVDKITVLANRMTMKDLLKSDLKTTIDHMQQAIGQTKSTPQMILNLRNFTEYLKTAIHPLHLYQALTGNIDLDAVTIHTPESALAKQGWFFLLGMIALTKFKGVDLNRRQTPGATDDLRIGATFLRLQLQFTPDRWDAWFRLAECFDYELDEAVLWTADKMNKDRADLVKFQRNSIHCYTLALSHSYAWASDPLAFVASDEDEDALYDLYHEFGMRLYASSREPFAMDPFKHADQERFFIETMGVGTYKKILHNEMSDYQVWKFAANLFKKAVVGKPKDWKNPYMAAKCLWKMYQKPLDTLDAKNRLSRPTVQAVLDALEKTVEVVSALPKPRHGQDPVLEPHYKILTVIHKLIKRGDLPAQEGANILQRQPYAPDRGEEVIILNADDWEAYVIKSLRYLRDKDKSNWQHRLIIRHARILFDENSTEDAGYILAAKAAFSVLRESMFTKTMVMNVWKCDAERPGRHHVYTEQYVRFMARLLAVMNDRVSLEMVLRRIRKKGIDFYHFNELWQSCVLTYVKLLRQTFRVVLTEEDAFKSLSPEDFEVVSERITAWAATGSAENNDALNAMKEAVEVKKLNANLMKAGPIDDLINDCYSTIYLDHKAEFAVPEPVRTTEEHSRPRDEDPRAENGTDVTTKKLSLLIGRDKELTTLGSLRAGSEQPDKPVSLAGEPAPRGRRPGVRRLDVIRKAEQAVLRAAEGPPKSAGANGTGTKSRLGSTSSGKNGHATPRGEDGESDEGGDEDDTHHGDDDDVEMKDADEEGGEQANGEGGSGGARGSSANVEHHHVEEGSDISSPPGSVHDSADDESDLSDVPADYEDDVPASLLFPNLRRSVDAGTAGRESTASTTSAGETEDEAEEEVEDGEEDEGEDEEEGGEDTEEGDGVTEVEEEGDEAEGVTEGEGEEAEEGDEGDETNAAEDTIDEEEGDESNGPEEEAEEAEEEEEDEEDEEHEGDEE
ncbi:hypothetical protein B0H67DRAFT_553369 [Lasiosphaeris hirsuta]|uniref:Histone transcription regulator 3 homolog n=1 Tax=Lasiosphaeris hirsuta TaxID=260670 RepID=A0AA40AF35_9PEZI|nr:hypothetical protein B0H67DRAFT_553369 [Lasiosphaeris hirsuta]